MSSTLLPDWDESIKVYYKHIKDAFYSAQEDLNKLISGPEAMSFVLPRDVIEEENRKLNEVFDHFYTKTRDMCGSSYNRNHEPLAVNWHPNDDTLDWSSNAVDYQGRGMSVASSARYMDSSQNAQARWRQMAEKFGEATEFRQAQKAHGQYHKLRIRVGENQQPKELYQAIVFGGTERALARGYRRIATAMFRRYYDARQRYARGTQTAEGDGVTVRSKVKREIAESVFGEEYFDRPTWAQRKVQDWRREGKPWDELIQTLGLGCVFLAPADLTEECLRSCNASCFKLFKDALFSRREDFGDILYEATKWVEDVLVSSED